MRILRRGLSAMGLARRDARSRGQFALPDGITRIGRPLLANTLDVWAVVDGNDMHVDDIVDAVDAVGSVRLRYAASAMVRVVAPTGEHRLPAGSGTVDVPLQLGWNNVDVISGSISRHVAVFGQATVILPGTDNRIVTFGDIGAGPMRVVCTGGAVQWVDNPGISNRWMGPVWGGDPPVISTRVIFGGGETYFLGDTRSTTPESAQVKSIGLFVDFMHSGGPVSLQFRDGWVQAAQYSDNITVYPLTYELRRQS